MVIVDPLRLMFRHRLETNTEARHLGFSYDFGVTIICHHNADAMVLASALMRDIQPPDNIQNGRCPGGECLS